MVQSEDYMPQEQEMAESVDSENWMQEEESKEDFEFELFLSTDGKNTVRVKANTPKGRTEAMKYAKAVYEKLVARYGTKAEQYTKANPIQTNGKEAPVCGVHGSTKVWIEGTSKTTGKPYGFWSCPTKNADGSFCKAK